MARASTATAMSCSARAWPAAVPMPMCPAARRISVGSMWGIWGAGGGAVSTIVFMGRPFDGWTGCLCACFCPVFGFVLG